MGCSHELSEQNCKLQSQRVPLAKLSWRSRRGCKSPCPSWQGVQNIVLGDPLYWLFLQFWGLSEGNSQYDLHPPAGKVRLHTPLAFSCSNRKGSPQNWLTRRYRGLSNRPQRQTWPRQRQTRLTRQEREDRHDLKGDCIRRLDWADSLCAPWPKPDKWLSLSSQTILRSRSNNPEGEVSYTEHN